jgi:hypothetical protein
MIDAELASFLEQGIAVELGTATSASILEGIEAGFGFTHSMIFVPGADDRVLVTIARRGYPESGVGAEVAIGEGIAGVVAEARKPIRISWLIRQMLYANARARARLRAGAPPGGAPHRAARPGGARQPARRAAPEPRRAGRRPVHRERAAVSLPRGGQDLDRAPRQLPGDRAMQLQERSESMREPAPLEPQAAGRTPARGASHPARREVAYYRADECVLVDGDYLIRSLPAKILWKLLTVQRNEGRVEFTNRELRLDKSLNLPEWRDNLESRLLLLRRRLEQKCPDIRIVPRARGRFALALDAEIVLVERP